MRAYIFELPCGDSIKDLITPVARGYNGRCDWCKSEGKHLIIEKIQEVHWSEILGIQDVSYQEVGTEELAVLKSKSAASPETCFVCLSNSGEVIGYVLAHPWSGVSPPKLFEPLPNIKTCEYLYLHDMAITPHLKGKGIGRAAAIKLFEVAKNKGIKKVNLVAIQGAERFWSKIGFHEVTGVSICTSYGDQAVLMEKMLTA